MVNKAIKFVSFICCVLIFSFIFSGCNIFGKDEDITFKFNETEKGIVLTGYEVGEDYQIPDLLEIPRTFNGKPVVEIGESAFFNSNFVEIKIPDTVTKIDQFAFAASRRLKRIKDIPDSVEEIADSAFENCSKLEEFVFPKNLKSLGNTVFRGSGLTEIQLKNVEKIGFNCFSKSDIEEIIFPKETYIVFVGEFQGIKAKTLIIKGTVRTLNKSAFADCEQLESVSFEKGFADIYTRAFANCKKLKEVNINEDIRFIADDAFADCPADTVFHVKKDSVGSEWAKAHKVKFQEY